MTSPMLPANMTRVFSSSLPERVLKLLPWPVNGVLLVLLSYLLYQLGVQFYQLLFPEQPAPPVVVNEQAEPARPAAPAVNVGKQIAGMHLFGEASDTQEVAASQQPTIAPDTRLNLELRGVYSTSDKYVGVAIIQDKNRNDENFFTVSQNVFGLATLEEIYHNRVILQRNGKYETLRLPEEFLSREHIYDNAALRAERKRVASNYRDIFLSRDGMELIKLFGFKPLHRGGGFIGFVVTAMGDKGREMMETLGIKDGDLVTVVNGMRLSESLEAVASLKELKIATSIDVIIEREGVEIPFHIELDPPPPELVESGTSADNEAGNPAAESTKTYKTYGESEEEQLEIEAAKLRTTGTREEIEFDH